MARVSPLMPSFVAGELSPWLEGRADLEQYGKGLRVCENFLPLLQGAITKRSGTYFVKPVKDSTKKAILVAFVFSDQQSYILEFGHLYVRFFTNRGQVLDGGSPYEVATPYVEADLPLLRFAQSADVLYIAHSGYAPRKLSRLAPTNWTLTAIDFLKGPMRDPEIGGPKITSTDVLPGATVTVTSDVNLFLPEHVGLLFEVYQEATGQVPPWEAGKTIGSANEQRRYNGNYYVNVASGTTGGDPPVHTEGAQLDGAGGVAWVFTHPGSGFVRFTAYVSATQMTGVVVSRLPQDLLTSVGSRKWSFAEWGASRGFPGAVTFYGDRLFWAGTQARPQTLWGSNVGEYETHERTTLDDSALSLTLNSGDVNVIRWLTGDEKGLFVGTISSEWVVRPSSSNEALTPFNAQAVRTTDYGSNFVKPTRVGKAVLFVQRAARKLREFAFLIDVDGFRAPDMCVRAEHISKSGFADLAFQSQPSSIVWAPRVDGIMAGFTYEREQEMTAWHRHILGGYADAGKTQSAVVEAAACISSPSGDRDDLWLIVRRYINGSSVRTVEWLTPVFDHETLQADGFFVDCGATYRGAPASVISNLDHLNGETVAVLADGAVHPDRTVMSGSIALDSAASVVHVGLRYRARFQTERPSAGAGDGTAQGKPKRIAEIIFRLYRSLSMKYGSSFDQMDELDVRSSEDAMDAVPPLYSGDQRLLSPSGWETDGCVCVESDTPTPLTILSITPIMEVTSPR